MATGLQRERNPPAPAALTAAQARRLVSDIHAHAGHIRRLLKELYDGEGWRALGYQSWEECVVAEFDFSTFHAYKLVRCAEVDEDLSSMVASPIGVMQAIVLSHVPRERRAEVYALALEKAGDRRRLSARLIREVVAARRVPKLLRPMGPEPRHGRRAAKLQAAAPAVSEVVSRRETLEREYDEIENRMPALALAYLYKRFKRLIPFAERRELIDRLRWATGEEVLSEFKSLTRGRSSADRIVSGVSSGSAQA